MSNCAKSSFKLGFILEATVSKMSPFSPLHLPFSTLWWRKSLWAYADHRPLWLVDGWAWWYGYQMWQKIPWLESTRRNARSKEGLLELWRKSLDPSYGLAKIRMCTTVVSVSDPLGEWAPGLGVCCGSPDEACMPWSNRHLVKSFLEIRIGWLDIKYCQFLCFQIWMMWMFLFRN